MDSFEDDFDRAAGSNEPLELRLIQLLDNLYLRDDLAHTSSDINDIFVAGFYLNTVLPLERKAEDYECCARHLDQLAHSRNVKYLAGPSFVAQLFVKTEETLRKGLKLFPQNLSIQLKLAEILLDKNYRNEISNYEEAKALIENVMLISKPCEDGFDEDYNNAQHLLNRCVPKTSFDDMEPVPY